MIRNEREYKEAVRRIKQDKAIIQKQKKSLEKLQLSPEDIKRAQDPMLSFHRQLVEEVEWYERVKRKDFDTISDLSEVGRLLIALRIAGNLTQKDLAKCLGVTEAQVSRDERNEYHGISLERAQKIFKTFGVHVKATLAFDRPLERKNILAAAS
jgi:DNA-directed RNA polymerase specialized sigma subunit